ncbi:MAG TPA: hypothetical protein PLY73_00525, partial [Candidatus Ozemobacteraceae bacterium]|nr:hypothetical protein [Candidatus Ozemobacteraceae bacterium]
MPETKPVSVIALAILGLFTALSAAGADLAASDTAGFSGMSASETEHVATESPNSAAANDSDVSIPQILIASETLAFASKTASLFASGMPSPGKQLRLSLGEAVFSALQRNRGL